jgi:hypothetical protein
MGHRNFMVLVVVIAVLSIAGVLYDAKQKLETPESQPETSTSTNSMDSTATSQLLEDLSGVTPQFVGTSTDPEVQKKIEVDIMVSLMSKAKTAEERQHYIDGTSEVSLHSFGKRYVTFGVVTPSDRPVGVRIYDAVTGQYSKDGLLPSPHLQVGTMEVYVSMNDICTYTLDTPDCVSIPGAKLSGDETYGDEANMAGELEPQGLTFTKDTLTIDVLNNKLEKVRTATLKLPK